MYSWEVANQVLVRKQRVSSLTDSILVYRFEPGTAVPGFHIPRRRARLAHLVRGWTYFAFAPLRYGSKSAHTRSTVAVSTGSVIGVFGSFSEKISRLTLPQVGEIASGG